MAFTRGLSEMIGKALAALPTTPASGTIKVDHDNVLGAAKIIRSQIDLLSDRIADRGVELLVQPAGGDSVSIEAATAWNNYLVQQDDSYAARVQQYIESLYNIVDQLRDSAVQYGFTEDQITNAFGERSA